MVTDTERELLALAKEQIDLNRSQTEAFRMQNRLLYGLSGAFMALVAELEARYPGVTETAMSGYRDAVAEFDADINGHGADPG